MDPKPKRNFSTTLDPEIIEQFWGFVRDNNCTSPSSAVNLLLRAQLAAMPEYGFMIAERNRAYNDTAKWVREKVFEALSDIQILLKEADR